jgi:hypothetical protein
MVRKAICLGPRPHFAPGIHRVPLQYGRKMQPFVGNAAISQLGCVTGNMEGKFRGGKLV